MSGIVVAIVVAAALGVLGIAVARYRRALARRWRLRRDPHRTRYPIVLVHGLMGFADVNVVGHRHEYFRGVEERLRALGAEVHRPRLPPLSSVAARAAALAAYVEKLDAPRINIIAHSMGGLDARYAVARLGLAPRVASVITVGTPHRGTPVADVGARLVDTIGLRPIAKALGVVVDAFHDLTSRRLEALNAEMHDARGVYYGSVVARAPANARMNQLLVATHRYVRSKAGDNDGLVPTASQVWGEVLREVEADHWAQIGWGSPFDACGLYADLARELKARGC